MWRPVQMSPLPPGLQIVSMWWYANDGLSLPCVGGTVAECAEVNDGVMVLGAVGEADVEEADVVDDGCGDCDEKEED